MNFHKIGLPREIIVGDKILKDTNNICKEIRMSGKCLILSGPKTMEIVGKGLKEVMERDYQAESRTVHNIKKQEVDQIIEESKNFDFIIGIGGGKVIDVSKYVAFELDKPFISIPTAPSHDGITSPRATLTYNGKKYSYEAKVPMAIIIDLDILSKAPYRMIAAGCADTIAKITAVSDWKLSHDKTGEKFYEYAATLSLLSAQIVLRSAEKIKNRDKEGIRTLMEALINSGIAMCIAGTSRPGSGSEHLFSHALDKLYPEKNTLHGEQCGVGTIISAYLMNLPWKEIRDTLKNLGCPVTAKELNIPDDIIVKALIGARDIRKDRYTILNEIEINEEKAISILKETGVIE